MTQATRIEIDPEIHLSGIRPDDRSEYVRYFREREIYDQTLRIPFPYTESDADQWIAICSERTAAFGHPVNWAIRDPGERLLGGIGFVDFSAGSHRVEIGYWLGKEHWNQGIMPRVVKAFCEFAHARWGFARITANVFDFNSRSARVLEKSGFQLEGTLRKHYSKDGRIFDGKLYARIF